MVLVSEDLGNFFLSMRRFRSPGFELTPKGRLCLGSNRGEKPWSEPNASMSGPISVLSPGGQQALYVISFSCERK